MRKGAGAPRRVGDADLAQQGRDTLPHLAPSDRLVGADRLGDLPAHRIARIERGHRLLEDHRDVAADHGATLARAQAQQVPPVELQRIGPDPAGLGDQPHQREHRHALARAGLADDAQDLAGIDGDVDRLDGMEPATGSAELYGQVADVEQGHAARAQPPGGAGQNGRASGAQAVIGRCYPASAWLQIRTGGRRHSEIRSPFIAW